MSKVYLVYESWGTCDDSNCIGAFLDENKANEYVNEHMKPREKELEQLKLCDKCRCRDKKDYDYTHDYDETFLLENECPLAKIGVDRNGKYCENEIEEYYNMYTNSYWVVPIEIIG